MAHGVVALHNQRLFSWEKQNNRFQQMNDNQS